MQHPVNPVVHPGILSKQLGVELQLLSQDYRMNDRIDRMAVENARRASPILWPS
jgi:hypothetical protein